MKRVAAARHPSSKTAALAIALAVGCQKAPAEHRQTAAASTAAVTPVAPASVAPKSPVFQEPVWRFPAAPRVVAIGDLHGDLNAARAALRLAGAIDEKDRWVGGKLVVVQTGDQLDRGDHDRKILDLLEKLELDARAAGGALVVLNGNHEIMNVAGDFRYVTKPSFSEFAEFAVGTAPPAKVPEFARGRFLAFAPRGVYAKQLSERLTVAVVGDTLFVHGGILPAHVTYGIGRINAEVSAWMRGDLPELPRIVQSDDAPVWTRLYGEPEVSELACRALGDVLQSLSAKRLVIGHTVQKAGINAACKDQVYRIDVGLSRYYGESPAQVLELRDGVARVLTASAAAPAH